MYTNMKIISFPNLRQTYAWDCGAKAMQSVLAYYGLDIREDIIMEIAGTNKQGTTIPGLKKVVKKYNLEFKSGKMTVKDIKKYLNKKIPVILVIQAWTGKVNVDWKNNWTNGHYVVAIGYDEKNFYFEDPSSLEINFLSYQELEERWHDIGINNKKYINWGMSIFGKKADYSPSQLVHLD